MVVVDASVTLSWCMPHERDPYALVVAATLTETSCVVPGVWALEVGNGLLQAERRGKITEAQRQTMVQSLGQLPIHVEHHTSATAFGTILDLARSHGLTTYDAAYLEVAHRLDLPLATLDTDLRKAARKAGVALFAA